MLRSGRIWSRCRRLRISASLYMSMTRGHLVKKRCWRCDIDVIGREEELTSVGEFVDGCLHLCLCLPVTSAHAPFSILHVAV